MDAIQSGSQITPAVIMSALSLLISLAALWLSFSNYRRDRPKVKVRLEWDTGYVGLRTNQKGRWGNIYVKNSGRRPVGITHVGLEIPGQVFSPNLLADEHNPIHKLGEHEQIVIKVAQDDHFLRSQAEHWRGIRALARDVADREYTSPKVGDKPSWVSGEQPGWVRSSLKRQARQLPSSDLSRPDVAWYKRRPWIRNKPPSS